MFRQFFIVTGMAGLPLLNEYAKTHITKTKSFRNAITQINTELKQIDIDLGKLQDGNSQTQDTNKLSEEERLFELVLNPQVDKYLSTKAKHKVQLIQRIKNEQKSIMKTNAIILAMHSVGFFFAPGFFYYSAILSAVLSQVSLANDIYTLRAGKIMVDVNMKAVWDLYVKGVGVAMLVFGIRGGIKRLGEYKESKQIIKREP